MSLPDYPRYVVRGQVRTGNPIDPKECYSDAQGNADIDLGRGWFHKLSITILEPLLLPDKLLLRYSTSFVRGGTTQTSPTYDSGEECPPGAMTDYIRAFRFSLGGTSRDEYVLTFQGRVNYKGASNPGKSYVGLKSGDWLGTERPDQGAPDEWVSQLTLSLHRT